MIIEEELYRTILRSVPIACVDVVIRNPSGRYLLVRRKNEPLAGEWWVVGGRVHHGETLLDAVSRKMREEVGVVAAGPVFMGVYEDRFDRNAFDVGEYHTVSMVFGVEIGAAPSIRLDCQSDDWKWATTLPKRFSSRLLGAEKVSKIKANN